MHINPFQPSVAFHIETSNFISNVSQNTGFHMKYNTGMKWFNKNMTHWVSKITDQMFLFHNQGFTLKLIRLNTINITLFQGQMMEDIIGDLIMWSFRKFQPGSLNAQKMRFSAKNFFSKCKQIRCFLRVCSDLPKKFLMENLLFCVVFDSN